MAWGRRDRGERIINDPMNVLIMGESYNYPAEITVDKDGTHLRAAMKLVHEAGETALGAVLGSDQHIENVLRAAQTVDTNEA
jgi:hypothetical protein